MNQERYIGFNSLALEPVVHTCLYFSEIKFLFIIFNKFTEMFTLNSNILNRPFIAVNTKE